ncbi:MAG TPA: Glu/Leu/Phe/Val dehydrogenase [Pyrinomonadaceae bacterium]|nr:Glu/Leu/Phe/Val dehydrogenase [Pyrinomonadaceae bacterium]
MIELNIEMRKSLCKIYGESEHEQVVLWTDGRSGYRGIIAIHNTSLGPAVGGTRFWNYASDEEASLDALRLSRAMTYKNALADLPFGGGKAIIIGDNRTTHREELFRAHGRFVESFGGRYITAEDVGTSPSDMDYVRVETAHITGLASKSGDPSPVTARGVFRALQAAAKRRWGSNDLEGRTIALQGCGNTGYHLAGELHRAGATLVLTDLDAGRLKRTAAEFGAKAVAPDEIYNVRADVFAPCALGGIINDETIHRLRVGIVCGTANNQLLEDRHGEALEERGILYVPDYVANAGGIINGCRELLGWDAERALGKVNDIYDTVLGVLDMAKAEGIAAHRAADRLAEKRLRKAGAVLRGSCLSAVSLGSADAPHQLFEPGTGA